MLPISQRGFMGIKKLIPEREKDCGAYFNQVTARPNSKNWHRRMPPMVATIFGREDPSLLTSSFTSRFTV
jgi:hypothetical protein